MTSHGHKAEPRTYISTLESVDTWMLKLETFPHEAINVTVTGQRLQGIQKFGIRNQKSNRKSGQRVDKGRRNDKG